MTWIRQLLNQLREVTSTDFYAIANSGFEAGPSNLHDIIANRLDNNYPEFAYFTHRTHGVRRAGAAALDLAFHIQSGAGGEPASACRLLDPAGAENRWSGVGSACRNRPKTPLWQPLPWS